LWVSCLKVVPLVEFGGKGVGERESAQLLMQSVKKKIA